MSHDPDAGRCLCTKCREYIRLAEAAEDLREEIAERRKLEERVRELEAYTKAIEARPWNETLERVAELEGLVEGNRLAGAEWRQRAEAYAHERDRALEEATRLRDGAAVREWAHLARESYEARTRLGDLLAVIHRDGGHYQEKHGTAKAVEDAIALWHALREEKP